MKICVLSSAHEGKYVVDVAIPKKSGGFLVFQYLKNSASGAAKVFNLYMSIFDSNPGIIEEFHLENVREYQRLKEVSLHGEDEL